MFTDIVDLRDFYQSGPGLSVRRLLRAGLFDMWPDLTGEDILALGYGVPLLRPLLGKARAVYALMPAAQGVAYWPREGPNMSALADPAALPLADNSVDRVIVLHALEGMADPAALFREIWRVLKSGGRMMALVPNRRGIWAHSDRTPFGNGQPYSAAQIKAALHQHGFFVERMRGALYGPPWALRAGLADRAERVGALLWPSFAGVWLVEAGKQHYAPVADKKARRMRLVLPLPLPVPAPTGAAAFRPNGP